MIKKHLVYIRLAIKLMMEYKLSFYAGFLVPLVEILAMIFLWRIVFEYTGSELIGGLTLSSMLTYYLISNFISVLGNGEDAGTSWMIRTGNILKDLSRPINHHLKVFITRYFKRLFKLSLVTPIIVIAIIVLDLSLTTNLLTWLLFLISLGLSTLMLFFMAQAFCTLSFWSNTIADTRHLFNLLNAFLGGGFLPITLFPLAMQRTLDFLPFIYTKFIPAFILMEQYTITESLWRIGVQIIWVGLLWLLLRWVWKKGLKRFDAQGG
jgi:ABC-2 type transport system permease protein